jgi:hypothetical protein
MQTRIVEILTYRDHRIQIGERGDTGWEVTVFLPVAERGTAIRALVSDRPEELPKLLAEARSLVRATATA